MVISYVLRLRSELVQDGILSGEVEAVGTGRRTGFGSMAQLADILTRSVPEEMAKAETNQQHSATTTNWSPQDTPNSGTSAGGTAHLRVR